MQGIGTAVRNCCDVIDSKLVCTIAALFAARIVERTIGADTILHTMVSGLFLVTQEQAAFVWASVVWVCPSTDSYIWDTSAPCHHEGSTHAYTVNRSGVVKRFAP